MAHRHLRDFHLALSHGPSSNDDEYLTLPKIGDYIDHHIDHDVSSEDTMGLMCTICQEDFTSPSPGRSPSTSSVTIANSDDGKDIGDERDGGEDNDGGRAVRILPCHHLFHNDCILSWMGSVAPTRNTCPVCRVKLFRLNVLRPEQAACVYEEDLEDGDRYWNFENYVRLLGYVDILTTTQLRLPSPDQDFASIPRAVRDFWAADDDEGAGLGMGGVHISSEHVALGGRWIELTAAARVLDHLREDGAALKIWAGQVFYGMYAAMVSTVRNMDVRGDSEEEEQQDYGVEGVYEEFGEETGSPIQRNLLPVSTEEFAAAFNVRRGVEELEESREEEDGEGEDEIISAEDLRAPRDYQARNGLSNEDLAEQLARESFLGQEGGEDEDGGGGVVDRARRRARDTQAHNGSGSEREMEEDDDDEDEPSRGWRQRRRHRLSTEDERNDGAALFAAAQEVLDEDEDEAEVQVNGDESADRTHARPTVSRNLAQLHSRLRQASIIYQEATTLTPPVEQPRRLIVRLPLPRHLRPSPPPSINNEEDQEDQDSMAIDSDDTLRADDDPATASSEQDQSAPQWSTIAHASASSSNQRVSTPRLPPVRPTVEPIDDFVPLGRGKRKREGSEDGERDRRGGRNARR